MLKKIKQQDREGVSKLLSSYWAERGMPEYDKRWAEEYLSEGHKKEITNDEFFVYKERNRVIGTISLITDVSNVAEIRDFVVKPEFRKKGYGRRILEGLIKLAESRKIRKIYALAFPKYEKFLDSLGFEKEGLLKNHFKDKEDLIIMSKFLR